MRAHTLGCRKAQPARVLAGAVALAVLSIPQVASADSGGVGLPPPGPSGGAPPQPAPVPGVKAKISRGGLSAIPPVTAPDSVKNAVYAANQIAGKPYRYGGGHRSFKDSGYDCSGAVSYALHGAGILDSPLHSSAFMSWAKPGKGQWITVYTNPGHAYTVIAGRRFDTSGTGGQGPRWRREKRSPRGYAARHPDGL